MTMMRSEKWFLMLLMLLDDNNDVDDDDFRDDYGANVYVSCDDSSYYQSDTDDQCQSNDEILARLLESKKEITALRQSVNDRLDNIEDDLNYTIKALKN